jgi:hypothetical protein
MFVVVEFGHIDDSYARAKASEIGRRPTQTELISRDSRPTRLNYMFF